jgi:hypothetical protein
MFKNIIFCKNSRLENRPDFAKKVLGGSGLENFPFSST